MKRVNTNNNTQDNSPYGVICNSDNVVVAFVNPVKGVELETIITALQAEGLNAEIRNPEVKEISVDGLFNKKDVEK